MRLLFWDKKSSSNATTIMGQRECPVTLASAMLSTPSQGGVNHCNQNASQCTMREFRSALWKAKGIKEIHCLSLAFRMIRFLREIEPVRIELPEPT